MRQYLSGLPTLPPGRRTVMRGGLHGETLSARVRTAASNMVMNSDARKGAKGKMDVCK